MIRGIITVLGRVADLIERRHAAIVMVSVLLFVGAAYVARDLPVDQNFQRLLPSDAPSVARLDAVSSRLGNQSDLVVAMRSPSREANLRFGADLAERLRERDDLRYVVFHKDPTFFEDNALLYADLDDLLELRDRVVRRIKKSVRRAVIQDVDDAEPDADDNDDSLDEDALEDRVSLDDRFDEYMEARDGAVVVLKARPTRSSSDLRFARKVNREIIETIAALNPTSYHPKLTVEVEGSYAEHTARARAMQSSVVEGSLAALLILLGSIAFYFRSVRAVGWVLAPLLLSGTAALAFARLTYGHLNIVSAFIFAVLLGLGIDFGVHLLARYRDLRRGGLTRASAVDGALRTTGASTAAGALSTAGCFGVLAFSSFQGFAQFGVVGAAGIVAALIAALVLMFALVAMTGDSVWSAAPAAPAPTPEPSTAPSFPVLALVVALLGVAIAAYGARVAPDLEFETDLSKLGPRSTKKKKTANPTDRDWRDALGKGGGTAPGVVLTRGIEQTGEVHRQLQALLDERTLLETPPAAPSDKAATVEAAPAPEDDFDDGDPFGDDGDPFGDDGDPFGDEDEPTPADPPEIARIRALAEAPPTADPEVQALLSNYSESRRADMLDRIDRVFSIHDFVPIQQRDKLIVIRDIKERIDKKRDALHADDQESLDEWYPKLEVTAPVTPDDLPTWVREQMTDLNGNVGHFAVFWARGRKADVSNARRIRDAFFDIAITGGTAPAAADYFTLPAIMDAIADDGPRVTALALMVMLFSAWWLLGGLRGPVIVLSVVGAALLWLIALASLMGWKADLFNLIALPLLVGMGMDDTLHLIHRYREESGPNRLFAAVRHTGPAIALTTWTTAVGFGGIFFANHDGLLSLARVSVSGIVLCLVASALWLPALLRLGEWWTARRAIR